MFLTVLKNLENSAPLDDRMRISRQPLDQISRLSKRRARVDHAEGTRVVSGARGELWTARPSAPPTPPPLLARYRLLHIIHPRRGARSVGGCSRRFQGWSRVHGSAEESLVGVEGSWKLGGKSRDVLPARLYIISSRTLSTSSSCCSATVACKAGFLVRYRTVALGLLSFGLCCC
jgi:hypothetical protein